MTGGEGSDAADVLCLVALGALTAERDAEVSGPGLDAHGVVGTDSKGRNIALASGKAIQVLVAGAIERKEYSMSQQLVVGHIGGCNRDTGCTSVYAGGIVDGHRTVGLGLGIAVIAGRYIEMLSYSRRSSGRIDVATGGVHLSVCQVV